MPELPEVETVRRILEHHITDALVERVGGRSIAMRRDLDLPLLQRQLTGRRTIAFRRRGKYLIVDLDDGAHALVHLGMSGRLMLQPPEAPRLPHTHLVLHLNGGRELRLVDPRRFGFFVWLPPGGDAEDRSLNALGVEPLEPGLTTVLPPLLKARRAQIKALILDQSLVAGVGNIYANEALWRSGIDPRRAPSRTSIKRLTLLAGCVRDVLVEACEQGGTTIRDFATPEGDFGYFAVQLAVYGKDGLPCPRCGQLLVGAPIGGRATTWCRSCQR